MFSIRLLTEEDYPLIFKWWSENRFPAIPQDCLPGNGTGGIMVGKEGKNICAGFVYFTNSKIAWIEFLVADFHYREDDRAEAIQFLLDGLCGIAERQGFKVVFSSVKHKNLIQKYEACGFAKNEGTVEFSKVFV
jgi:hypothetical protein